MNRIPLACAVFLSLAIFGQGFSLAQTRPSDAPTTRHVMLAMSPAKLTEWQTVWEKSIKNEARNRYCDKELGEETGWLMSPLMNGFYYGYMSTKDTQWIDMLVDWTDSWIKRETIEPDGYPGWPKLGAAGTDVDKLNDFNADSLLGDAMVLRPVVMMSDRILKTPALKEKYGDKATGYIQLAETIFEKWDKRGAWRDTEGGGNITIVLPYGIDPATGKWTAGYDKRNSPDIGFSHPNNKANLVAQWLLAMSDATQKPIYKTRAEKWFKLMKSRMKLKADGTYEIWNYWQPAGPWDLQPDGSTKHWVGVHPNGGYYEIDAGGIVAAYEHGLIFDRTDLAHLIATAKAEKRYWTALATYDDDIQKDFETTTKPDGWGGLTDVPWYLSLQVALSQPPGNH